MLPLLIPAAAGALEFEAGAAAAWATLAAGSLIHATNGLEFRQPRHLQLPPALGRGPSLQEMIADAIAGAKIPVGSPENSPPPPGGGLEGLAQFIAAAAAAAQAWWAQFNRPRVPDTVGIWENAPPGTRVNITTSPRVTSYSIAVSAQMASWYGGWTFYEGTFNYWRIGGGSDAYTVTNTAINLGPVYIGEGGVSLQSFDIRQDGSDAQGNAAWRGLPQYLIKAGSLFVSIQPTESNTSGWVTRTNLSPPAPWTTPLPSRTPAAAPAQPALQPASTSGTAPATAAPAMSASMAEQLGAMAGLPLWLWSFDSAGQPATTTTTTTVTQYQPSPWSVPSQPPFPAPQPLPQSTTPLTSAGTMPATAPAPSPVTDPTAHIINGTAISGATARADLESIAAELTRVEAKLASLMRPAQNRPNGGNWIDDLADLINLARMLYDALTTDVPATEWEVFAPCDKNPDGTPKKIKHEFPAEDYLPATLRRLEALMNVYGNTLAWRRGVCKGAVTNNVTITAYAIDPLTPESNG